jgi:porphyrinogen peroxidase
MDHEMSQPIVLSDSPRHLACLVLGRVASRRDLAADVRAALEAANAVAALDPAAGTRLGIGFGDRLWRELTPSASPPGLTSFEGVRGRQHTAPATQGDLLVLAESERADLVFECLLRARTRLGRGATVIDELHGFRYLDTRDLTGFVDGTGNPPVEERATVATIANGDFAGGSFAFVQRWEHSLGAVAAMPVAEREKMIGRTLASNVELDDVVKPVDSHLSRVEIEENGEELAIYRKSMPYGDTTRHGLLFLAFTRDPSIITRMLRRIFGADQDGKSDRLLAVSRPVTGGFYFLPSAERIAAL